MSTPKEQAFEAICSALYQTEGLIDFLGEGDEAGIGHVAYFVARDGGEPVMEVQVVRHEPEEQISVRRRWRAVDEDAQPGFVTVEGHFVTNEHTMAELRTPVQEAVLGVLTGFRELLGG